MSTNSGAPCGCSPGTDEIGRSRQAACAKLTRLRPVCLDV